MNRQTNIGALERDDASYEVDVAAWCEAQSALLRVRAFEAIDLDNIIEEIESLGGEQGHAISSHMARLMEHLLKLDASTDPNPRRGWRKTVVEQRARMKRRLQKNPSLRRRLPEYLEDEWAVSVVTAKAGLREDEEHLVDGVLRYTVEQLLDDRYFGEREATA
jgi:hypothetical protein